MRRDLLDVLAAFDRSDRVRIKDAVNVAGVALADYRLASDGRWYSDHNETVLICRKAIVSSVPLPHFVRTGDDPRWPWRLELGGGSPED